MKKKEARPGGWLTQATAIDENNRIFVKSVAGFGDLETLYRDATDEEKTEWDALHPEDVLEENGN